MLKQKLIKFLFVKNTEKNIIIKKISNFIIFNLDININFID